MIWNFFQEFEDDVKTYDGSSYLPNNVEGKSSFRTTIIDWWLIWLFLYSILRNRILGKLVCLLLIYNTWLLTGCGSNLPHTGRAEGSVVSVKQEHEEVKWCCLLWIDILCTYHYVHCFSLRNLCFLTVEWHGLWIISRWWF